MIVSPAEFHLSFRVSDLEESTAFYTNFLGVEPKDRTPRFSTFIVPHLRLNLVLLTTPDGMRLARLVAQDFSANIRPGGFTVLRVNNSYHCLKFPSVCDCPLASSLHDHYIIRMQQFPGSPKSLEVRTEYFRNICRKDGFSFSQIPVPHRHAGRNHAFFQAFLTDAKFVLCMFLLGNVRPFDKNTRDGAIRLDDGLIDEVDE